MTTKVVATKALVDPRTALFQLLQTVPVQDGDDRIDDKTSNLIADQIGINGDFYVNPETGKSYVSLESLAVSLTSILRTHVSKVSDGSHTFEELYDHRCLLFVSLMQLVADGSCEQYGIHDVWFSQFHDDGSRFDGYIIVGILTDNGQCTYHIKENPYGAILRERTDIRELPKAPAWDGHNSQVVLDRICNAFFKTTLAQATK